MAKELAKVYDPKATEDSIYQFWMDHGCFDAQVDKDKRPYSIVMPPPNVTGQLHMGHAFDVALQDAIIRQKRMQGYEALWMPGMRPRRHRHPDQGGGVPAGKRGTRPATTWAAKNSCKRVWQWKEQYGGRIVDQQKKLGASRDWDRCRFTMDEGCSKAVREAFVQPVRERADLPGQPHHQLVPPLRHGPFRRRGGIQRKGRPPVAHAHTRLTRRQQVV